MIIIIIIIIIIIKIKIKIMIKIKPPKRSACYLSSVRLSGTSHAIANKQNKTNRHKPNKMETICPQKWCSRRNRVVK